MEEYKLKFSLPYITCDNFKEKELINFIGIINGSIIGQYFNGSNYAHIDFDKTDKQKINPIVSVFDSFYRSKTNCIILNLKDNVYYNKIFIYQTLFKNSGFYGIVAYNTETNKNLHIYNIDLNYTSLIINLDRIISKNNKL